MKRFCLDATHSNILQDFKISRLKDMYFHALVLFLTLAHLILNQDVSGLPSCGVSSSLLTFTYGRTTNLLDVLYTRSEGYVEHVYLCPSIRWPYMAALFVFSYSSPAL